MKFTKFNINLSLVLILALVIAGSYVLNKPSLVEGSISIGNGYMYKTITSSNASSTSPMSIKVQGTTILGSIVVASSSATNIRIYDATVSTSTGTLITPIKAGVSEQTFVFDINPKTGGILIDVPAGFNGSYVVTYR